MILSIEGTDGSGKSYLAEYLTAEYSFENIRSYYENFSIKFNYEKSDSVNHVALYFYLFDKYKSDVIEQIDTSDLIVEKYGFTNNAIFSSMKKYFEQYHYDPNKLAMPKDLFCETMDKIRCQDSFNKAVQDKNSPTNKFNVCDTDYFSETGMFYRPTAMVLVDTDERTLLKRLSDRAHLDFFEKNKEFILGYKKALKDQYKSKILPIVDGTKDRKANAQRVMALNKTGRNMRKANG